MTHLFLQLKIFWVHKTQTNKYKTKNEQIQTKHKHKQNKSQTGKLEAGGVRANSTSPTTSIHSAPSTIQPLFQTDVFLNALGISKQDLPDGFDVCCLSKCASEISPKLIDGVIPQHNWDEVCLFLCLCLFVCCVCMLCLFVCCCL